MRVPVGLALPVDAGVICAANLPGSVSKASEFRVVPRLAATVLKDAPPPDATPVDGTRQALQPLTCANAYHAPLPRFLKWADELDFRPTRILLDLVRRDPPPLQRSVYPRNEEDIAQPSLDGRDARKQDPRYRIAQRTEPHFVYGSRLAKQIQHTLHLVAVARREVQPRHNRFHASTLLKTSRVSRRRRRPTPQS